MTSKARAKQARTSQPLHSISPEDLYYSLVTASPDGILVVDTLGDIIFASPRTLEMFRYATVDEVLGKSAFDWVAPEHLEQVRENFRRTLKGLPLQDICYRFTRSDGSVFWGEVTRALLRDSAGGPAGVVIVMRDVTQRRRNEEALRMSEEKFAKAFRISPDSININRLSDGVYLDINEGFTRITGYAAEDVIGRSSLPGDLGLWVDKEDRDQLVAGLKASGEVLDLEARFRMKNGEVRVGLMSARILEIGGEKCILSITRDITERKRTEEILQNAQKLESVGILAGGIAHDFNNLLTGIFGHLELALEQCKAGTYGRLPEVLTEALSSFGRARDLTQQLLTFTKGGAPSTQAEDIVPLIRRTVHFALSGSNVNPVFDLPEGSLPCEIDRNQIAQVLDNIVINAKQAMGSGGSLEVSARTLARGQTLQHGLEDRGYVRIIIADHGPGIPREIIHRIFDPFFTTKPEGTGLGLSIAHSIVRKHGGALTVESEPGQGTVFQILLPAAERAAVKPVVSTSESFKGAGSVLVMDDEMAVRDVLSRMLRLLGYESVAVAGSVEAVRVFQERLSAGAPFSFVILDLTIPGERGGDETLRELRRIDPKVKVVASSGYFDSPVIGSPAEDGYSAKLVKPFTKKDLADAIIACRGESGR